MSDIEDIDEKLQEMLGEEIKQLEKLNIRLKNLRSAKSRYQSGKKKINRKSNKAARTARRHLRA